jgi:hypothetical protein
MRLNNKVENTNKIAVGIKDQMKDTRMMREAQEQQTKRIVFLEEEVKARSSIITRNDNILLDIQEKLRR